MDFKFSKVNEWLGKCFPNGIPEYEITKKSIDLLSELQYLCKMHEELSDAIKQDTNRITNEYNAEAVRMEVALKDVGLSAELLTSESQNYINIISQFYNVLGMHEADDTSAKSSVFNAFRDLLKTNSELEITTLLTDNVNQLYEMLKQRLQQLKKFENEIQAKKISSAESKQLMQTLISNNFVNSEECKDKITLIETVLSERRFSPSVSYEEIRKKYEHIEVLKSELSALNSNIARYHDLPVDFKSAQQIVDKIKDELKILDEILNVKMAATVATS